MHVCLHVCLFVCLFVGWLVGLFVCCLLLFGHYYSCLLFVLVSVCL